MTAEQYAEALPEYQRFLTLIVLATYPGLGMFSRAIDTVWHSHILSTHRYQDFSDRYFQGHIIHHLPCLEPKARGSVRCVIAAQAVTPSVKTVREMHCFLSAMLSTEKRSTLALLARLNTFTRRIWRFSNVSLRQSGRSLWEKSKASLWRDHRGDRIR
jgi:hypothetical protein